MGLFSSNNEVNAEKKGFDVEEAEKILKEKYDLSDIDPRDLGQVKTMLKQAAELGLHDYKNIPGNNLKILEEIDKQQKLEIEQKFLLIKQNDRLNKNLEQLFYLLEDKTNL
ncbi:MAG: hypothetical protein PUG67_06350 [Peptoniphilaceae bacterium]|nr:hypothetical protein [Peptoniphilaceae bacterium]MDY6018129.1 hypothetical protein [Anaerococcus sp.]